MTTIRCLFSTASQVALAGAALIGGATAAHAQVPATDPARPSAAGPEAEDALDQDAGTPAREPAAGASGESDIVVTGSRIVRAGYDAPTPTTVIGSELLVDKAPNTLVDALATLPAFKNTATPGTAGIGVAGTAGQSFVNLRGLGTTRTLVLLDGKRVVAATATASVDVATLPSALVKRVDAVTGGASAAYGSDAVAGVVNFVLDTSFTGLKGEIVSGISAHGDAENYKGTLTYGTGFADDRGHFLLSGEYFNTDGVGRADRSFSRYNYAVLANPAYTPTNGEFQRLVLPFAYFSQQSFGGVILSGPLRNQQFTPGGGLAPFPVGYLVAGATQAQRGPTDLPFIGNTAVLSVPVERYSIYGRASYDVAEGVTAYVEGNYAVSETGPFSTSAASTATRGAITVQRDNAFLPAAVRTALVNANVNSFTMGFFRNDWGPGRVTRENTTKRGVIGLDAKFGDWTLNSYYEHGENTDIYYIRNNVLFNRLVAAADSIVAPAGNPGGAPAGQITCRVNTDASTTNDRPGCVPLNIFGVGSATPAMLAYIFADSYAKLDLTQDVASASISGEPFSLWAGPVSVAAGAEYRREKAVQVVDPLSAASEFAIGNPQPINGKFDVKEAFGEIVVPLLADSVIAKKLDLNAAVRLTDYSTSGTVTTWKVGATWDVFDDLRLRATRSRDIRAPNIIELFSSTVQSTGSVLDPFRNNAQSFTQVYSAGNRNLQPEKADTTAAGIVYQPGWLRGFSASVDYYRISIDGAIATLSLQDIVNRCFNGNTALCPLITRDSLGAINGITNTYLNLQSLKTRGVDFETSYRFGLFGGNAAVRLLASYVDQFATNDGVTTIDRAGDITQGQPKWNFDFTGTYTTGPWTFFVDAARIGSGKYDVTFTAPTAIDDNTIPSKVYINASIQHRIDIGADRDATFFFNVANLLGTEPPNIYNYSGGANYDRIGTAFKFGLRFNL